MTMAVAEMINRFNKIPDEPCKWAFKMRRFSVFIGPFTNGERMAKWHEQMKKVRLTLSLWLRWHKGTPEKNVFLVCHENMLG